MCFPVGMKPFERFAASINRTESGCWLWLKRTNSEGYGAMFLNRRFVQAHRFAFEQFRYEIPIGLELDHLCRVRNCVNPFHLEPVTRKVNILRGDGITAKFARRSHCKNGHEFTPENTKIQTSPDGSIRRRCLICKKRSYQRNAHPDNQAPRPV